MRDLVPVQQTEGRMVARDRACGVARPDRVQQFMLPHPMRITLSYDTPPVTSKNQLPIGRVELGEVFVNDLGARFLAYEITTPDETFYFVPELGQMFKERDDG